MSDSYLAISAIASNGAMIERLRSCATQQAHLGNVDFKGQAPTAWVDSNRYVWASSPSWGEKWQYALDTHTDPDPPYDPGRDATVITDDDILAAVQALAA